LAGLVAGVAFIVLFALYEPEPAESTVIIPEGSSYSESGRNFTPETITVMIGVNNTVVWVNQDTVPGSVIANDQSDPDFFDATSKPDFLMPGDEFRHTFTLPGEFGYHSEPHPWMRGAVTVLPGR
jgi:plastocyanin